ncbi:hypothetical protein FRC10_006510 [Ceratobasidium sp. 414]|nr:hypothetical protein FRC10_006510 [Ceratobasidium sp. 414]
MTSMLHTLLENHVFELKSDSRARSRAVAVGALDSGRNVLVESPLAVAVHPTHKGRRCDECLREAEGLQKCSGSGGVEPCVLTIGQAASWKRHHRRLCGFSKTYVQSDVYKDATEDSRADVFLLAQLAAEHFYKLMTLDNTQSSTNAFVRTFWDLLTSSNTPDKNLVPALSFTSPSVLSAAAARFGNNNFVVHDARLVPYAHGVFALASRSFNHSCKPNAAAMFEETQGGIRMVVKLLEDVAEGQETRPRLTQSVVTH